MRAATLPLAIVLASLAPCGAGTASAQGGLAPDRRLESQLESIYENVEGLEGVRVEVRSGVVRLEGEAATREAREQAVDLARQQEGVVYVDDRIEETSDVGERVQPALGRLKAWGRGLLAMLPLIGIAIGVIVLFWLLAKVIRDWDAPFRLFHRKRLVRGILRQVIATVVFLVGVVIALELVEATALVGALLGAAGLAGLAVGFAFRDIFENYLASVLLGARKPFALGDHVVIDEHEGKVMRLTTRETVLMTLEGNHLRLPNALVYKAVILNYSRNPLRLFSFVAGVSVETELAEAQRIGIDALLSTRGVTSDPAPFTRIEALGESNVVVRYFAWVDQREADWYKVKSEAIRRVKSALDAAEIEMPVPIYRIQTVSPGTAERTTAARHQQAERELSEPAQEVEVDRVIERQMESDLRSEDEQNLLREG